MCQDFDYRHFSIVNFYASQWEFSIAITVFVYLFSVVTSFVNKGYDRKLSFAFLVITHNNVKVVFTMCRSCMYATSTCFKCYMVATQYSRITFYEWMFEFSQFQICTRETIYDFVVFDADIFHSRINKFSSHQVVFVAYFYPAVFKLRVNGNSYVGRHCPRSSCPNNGVCLFWIYASWQCYLFLGYVREFYVNGERFFLSIFNFCFCQCSFTVCTPVYSFKPFVDMAAFCHFAEDTKLFYFELRAQCQIRAFPFA